MNIENWKKKYKAKANLQKYKKAEDDYEMLVTPDQIKKYENSKNALFAKELQDCLKIDNAKPLSQFEYCSYRDHMIYIVHFCGAHRFGVTAHMSMNEYARHKVLGNGIRVVSVSDHKTVAKYGPARVTLNPLEFEWFEIFVKFVRPKLPTNNSDKFFLSWSGNEMSPGDISGRLNSLWVKAGIFDGRCIPKKLSANIVRKTTSTMVNDESIPFYNQRGIVAGSMAHSKKTAAVHYETKNQLDHAVKGSDIIRKSFQSSPSKPRVDFIPHSPININQGSFNTPKKIWSNDETSLLSSLFPENQNITYSQVRSSLANSPSNSFNCSPRQVYDKLKSIKRKCTVTEIDTKTKRHLSYDRKSWSAEQLNDLKNHGKDLILGGPLSQTRIVDVLQNTSLLENFTVTQIRTRINHERS
ncbi:uncharacterized protein LOC136075061 [Hydra vulgaris]|uniref:Uncharacterized protein LOC136075061 n=1 Tax=Hydra vulgaris TaxID=6087 RepID=A0ABM4B3H4_HYDVU